MPTAANRNEALSTRLHPGRRWMAGMFIAAFAILICLLRWGGYLLVADDPPPPHVDTAVVLQGSIAGENARIRGAMLLLEQGTARRMLLSIPQNSFWDEPIAPMAHHYLERKYGSELASRVDFCQTGPEVSSTEDEARTLVRCIHQHAWQNIAVVTSDYHTRRAGMVWRRILGEEDPGTRLWMHAVSDPEFQAKGWWRKRIYTKTWVLESVKLIWTTLCG